MANIHLPPRKARLEHYRHGYPRLAAFVNLDRSFTIFKRFDYLHSRLLLEQQTLLNELESKLNGCDDEENIPMHLSSCRQDFNRTRRHLLTTIRTELASYDNAIIRYNKVLALPQASTENRESVKNWVDGTKPLVRTESGCFLESALEDDFVHLGLSDSDSGGIESLLNACLRNFTALADRIRSNKAKTDSPYIVLFSPKLLHAINTYLLMVLVPLWLIVPGILLFEYTGIRQRAILYSIFTLGTAGAVKFVANFSKYNFIVAIIAGVLAAFLSGGTSSKPAT